MLSSLSTNQYQKLAKYQVFRMTLFTIGICDTLETSSATHILTFQRALSADLYLKQQSWYQSVCKDCINRLNYDVDIKKHFKEKTVVYSMQRYISYN